GSKLNQDGCSVERDGIEWPRTSARQGPEALSSIVRNQSAHPVQPFGQGVFCVCGRRKGLKMIGISFTFPPTQTQNTPCRTPILIEF
ncbi:hypothetical protein, partial [Rhizobium paknamense]|uniref:hypothetical protein n=1 Tax=Rhizobium paknamense TaxID=1206817 RepID=UPI0035E717D0